MTFRTFFAAALLLLLAGCFTAPLQAPSSFYVMRHLNTVPGTADPDLTPEGQRQAQLLANWIGSEPPATIFVSNTRRAQQTAAPLAARLGITPIIYNPADTAGLISDVMKEPHPVLIVGHSNTVPEIVQALGGIRPNPIAHDQFGEIWHIRGRAVTMRRVGGS